MAAFVRCWPEHTQTMQTFHNNERRHDGHFECSTSNQGDIREHSSTCDDAAIARALAESEAPQPRGPDTSSDALLAQQLHESEVQKLSEYTEAAVSLYYRPCVWLCVTSTPDTALTHIAAADAHPQCGRQTKAGACAAGHEPWHHCSVDLTSCGCGIVHGM